MGDLIGRLNRFYPGFEILETEEQLSAANLYTSWKLWLNRREGFASRFIEGITERNVRKQLNVVAETGDRLEEALRKILMILATELWGENGRQEMQQRAGKNKPPERWTLGELVEAGSQMVKWANDREIPTSMEQSEFPVLREFVELRNGAVHQASRSQAESLTLPERAAQLLTRIFPIYYRLEDDLWQASLLAP